MKIRIAFRAGFEAGTLQTPGAADEGCALARA
jgi:hypothetical protein